MTFTEFCAANNIKLQQADIVFIKKQLQRLPEEHRKAVVRRYCEIWCKVRDATERSVAAQNAARFASNTWLRGIVSGEVVLGARG